MAGQSCEDCGAVAVATVEILDVDGSTIGVDIVCGDHCRQLEALLIPTYAGGEPAFRVDRYPAPRL